MRHALNIVPTTQSVSLRGGRSEIAFTVSNTGSQAFRVTIDALPSDASAAPFVSIKGSRERLLSANSTEQVTIVVAVPAEVEAKTFDVRLRVVSESNPDEDWAESQGVRVLVDQVITRKFPWWIPVAAVAVLAVIGVLVFVLTRKPGLHDACSGSCGSDLVCASDANGRRVCLADLGKSCAAGDDCTTGSCTGGVCGPPGLGAKCTSVCATGLACMSGTCQPAVLKHMPAECRVGRAYVQIADLLGRDVIAKLAEAQEKWINQYAENDQSMNDIRGRWAALKREGVDPLLLIQSMALCADRAPGPNGDVERFVAAIGLNAPKAIEYQNLFAGIGGDNGPSVGVAAPDVVFVVSRMRDLGWSKSGGGAAAFAELTKSLTHVDFTSRDPMRTVVDVREEAATLNGRVDLTMPAGTDLGTRLQNMRNDAQSTANRLPATWSILANRLRAAQFSLEGDAIVVRASISRADLLQLVTTLTGMTPDAVLQGR